MTMPANRPSRWHQPGVADALEAAPQPQALAPSGLRARFGELFAYREDRGVLTPE